MQRDPNFIKSNLYTKDNKIYTKQKTIIEFPKWYANKELYTIEDVTYLYGIFPIIIDNKYSVSLIPTLITTNPIAINETKKDEEEYIQFIYGKDSCLIENTQIVKRETLSYNIFESLYVRAKIPWFLEYKDLLTILNNMHKYAGTKIGSNDIANELIVSFITRNKQNKRLFYRQIQSGDIEYIDLLNPYWATLSTVNKLAGNYFDKSLTSALIQKEKEPNKLETLIRR